MEIRDYDENIERKITHLEKKAHKALIKRKKDRNMYKALEEVFDVETLMAIYTLRNKSIIDRMFGVVKTGKEARIYWAKNAYNQDLAIKIFLILTSDFRDSRLLYIDGDRRFKRTSKSMRDIIFLWCRKEYVNLRTALNAGIPVPKPFAYYKNVLVMEFIGENGVPAPILRDTDLKKPDDVYLQIMNFIKKAYKLGKIVHSDLSEYNIMMWKEIPYIIDWGQAVSIYHPRSIFFLKRDILNISKFFSRLGVKTLDLNKVMEDILQ